MSKTTNKANTMLEAVRLEVDRETEQIVHRLTDSLQAAAQYEPAWTSELRGEFGRMVSRQHFDDASQRLEQRLQTLERRFLEGSDTARLMERLDSLGHRMDAQAELLREQKRMLEEQAARMRRLDRPWYRRIFG